MTNSTNDSLSYALADEPTIDAILRTLETDTDEVTNLISAALERHPGDWRLLFLRGAVLASNRQNDEARDAFVNCTSLMPDFYPAWFMLGFLDLFEGKVVEARNAWAALEHLPVDDALLACTRGLLLLAIDQYEPAIAELRRAQKAHAAYPALMPYLQSVILSTEQYYAAIAGEISRPAAGNHVLLAEYLTSPTRH
jgi:predicted Zn-dependent protease